MLVLADVSIIQCRPILQCRVNGSEQGTIVKYISIGSNNEWTLHSSIHRRKDCRKYIFNLVIQPSESLIMQHCFQQIFLCTPYSVLLRYPSNKMKLGNFFLRSIYAVSNIKNAIKMFIEAFGGRREGTCRLQWPWPWKTQEETDISSSMAWCIAVGSWRILNT